MSSPFDHICARCGTTISLHTFYGRKMLCVDGAPASFEVWQVIEVRRALGHKVAPEWAVAAKRSKEVQEMKSRRDSGR